MPIRVALVDDHSLVAEATGHLLQGEEDLDVVGVAGTGEEGIALLERLRPDVALVDMKLPGMSGLELARLAASSTPEVAVLVLSAYGDDAFVFEALEVGVAGYLLKTAGAQEVIDAVRAVAHGVFVLDSALLVHLVRRRRASAKRRTPSRTTSSSKGRSPDIASVPSPPRASPASSSQPDSGRLRCCRCGASAIEPMP